jgi:hypothetical protein
MVAKLLEASGAGGCGVFQGFIRWGRCIDFVAGGKGCGINVLRFEGVRGVLIWVRCIDIGTVAVAFVGDGPLTPALSLGERGPNAVCL